MRSKAKLVVVLLAVISVEWVQANPRRSQCNDCENNSRGNQVGVIIDQQDVTVEGDEITGIKVNQENVKLKGGHHGSEIGAQITQDGVNIHGGSRKVIGIDLNQKDLTIGGSTECTTSRCGNGNDGSGSEEIHGSDDSDGCGPHESRRANGCSRPSGNTNRGPTNTQQGNIPSGTNGDIDDKRFGSPKPPKIQQPSCADRPLNYCGIFDGVPVHARDCDHPYQRCLPSNTIPTGPRNPRFPNGGNGPMRQPNGNGGPAPGRRFNGDYTHGSENGWDSTNTNDVSSGEERYPSVTGKPPRVQQPSCADRQMVLCKFWDGLPVFAYDCNNPFQSCPPSNTRPKGSRNPQFPYGNHGLNRQPNGNGVPAPGQQFNDGYTEGSENGWDSTYHRETNTHHRDQQYDCQGSGNNCQEQPPRQGNGDGNTHHGDQEYNCQSSGNNCQQPSNIPQNSDDEDYSHPTYRGSFFDKIFGDRQRPRHRSSFQQRVFDDGNTLMAYNGPGQFVAITDDGIITSNN